MTSNDITLIIP